MTMRKVGMRTMICPYCKYRIQANAPDPIYCGPHRASVGPATYPRVEMVELVDGEDEDRK